MEDATSVLTGTDECAIPGTAPDYDAVRQIPQPPISDFDRAFARTSRMERSLRPQEPFGVVMKTFSSDATLCGTTASGSRLAGNIHRSNRHRTGPLAMQRQQAKLQEAGDHEVGNNPQGTVVGLAEDVDGGHRNEREDDHRCERAKCALEAS